MRSRAPILAAFGGTVRWEKQEEEREEEQEPEQEPEQEQEQEEWL